MRADYVHKEELQHIFAALTPPNRLAIEISLATGLRISDVLNMRSEALRNAADRRISLRELKTGKRRAIKLPVELYDRALSIAGKIYVFENRIDYKRPRSRQAVYKDIKRAATLFRVKDVNLTPHSARKTYAVEEYHKTGSIKRVQKLLNHSSEAVTMIYAMADQMTEKRLGKSKKGPK